MKELLKVFKEIFKYMMKTKKWWLTPLILLLVLIGFLIFTTSSAPVPVFVYPLV